MGGVRDNSRGWVTAAIMLAACSLLIVVGVYVMGPASAPGDGESRASQADSEGLQRVIEAAETLRLQGEAEKSEAVLREAISDYADKQDAHIALGELLIDKASVVSENSAAQDTLAQAYECYERALSIGPRTADLEFIAGTLATKIDRWERALEHYAAAQALDDRDPKYPLYLAQVQLKFNRLAEAKANLVRTASLDPSIAAAWGTLAEVALRENAAESAIELIAKARTIEPGKTVWRLIEARSLKRLNKPQEALQVLVGLNDSEKLDVGVLAVIGECYDMLDQPAPVADLYVKATRLNPSDGQLALDASRWLRRAGRVQEAIENAERAAMLGVSGAREMVRELKGE
jgi:tetratricopeptide (TPR) repeat protein